jgi:hypothetical protein
MLAAENKALLQVELYLYLSITKTPRKGTDQTEDKHHSQNPQIFCFHKNETVLVGRCPNTALHFYMLIFVSNRIPKALISDTLIALIHTRTNRRTVSHEKKNHLNTLATNSCKLVPYRF